MLYDKRSASRQTPSLRPRLLIAGAAIVVAAGYFALYLSRPSPPSAPAVASPAGRLVKVEVHVTPPEAAISIDGQGVEGNPYTVTRVADGFVHQVEAVAPGHVPSRLDFALDGDITIKVTLERPPGDKTR